MKPDKLGELYKHRTLYLGEDSEGEVVATVVRRVDSPNTGRAALYIHGFSDYFFHPHVADFFVERGFAFYALDLRKAGRSILPHQTPHFIRHIPEYFSELDVTARILTEEYHHDSIVVYAHSTGALTAALWAHRMRKHSWLSGLIFNSPFFEINIADLVKRLGVAPLDIAGLFAPMRVLPKAGSSLNVESLHRDLRGEWEFDLGWKPVQGTPIRLGWLRAVDRAQRQLRRGLEIKTPILVAAAQDGYREAEWNDAIHNADAVLDPDAIVRSAPNLGPDVDVVRISGGRHDLALSREPARHLFFSELDTWLRSRSLMP